MNSKLFLLICPLMFSWIGKILDFGYKRAAHPHPICLARTLTPWVFCLPTCLFVSLSVYGRDPFNQNFRKFRFFRSVRSNRKSSGLDQSDRFSIPLPRCWVISMWNMEEHTLLMASLSVLLVNPCPVASGLLLLRK